MKKKAFSAITMLIFCLVFTFNFNINAFIAGNEGEKAYCGSGSGNPCPPAPPKTTTSNIKDVGETGLPTIRELIVFGGGYLLQSSSDINAFLNKIELSELSSGGPDYKGLKRTINAAIYHMEKASATYFQLKTLAAVTPYNQEVIHRLINFDYDAFQQENGLFPSVFAKVKEFLSVGDVTGAFNEFYFYSVQILDLLYTLKRDVAAEIFPVLSTIWNVNQKYSEFKLFGQYASLIFYSIKDQHQ